VVIVVNDDQAMYLGKPTTLQHSQYTIAINWEVLIVTNSMRVYHAISKLIEQKNDQAVNKHYLMTGPKGNHFV